MSIGNSGRIVIEIDPEMKKDLYEALIKSGMTMKEWVIENAQAFIINQSQLPLGLVERKQDTENMINNER